MFDMAEDEEVIRKGSALYEYLHSVGLTNFESLDLNKVDSSRIQGKLNSSMQVSHPAPQWTVDYLNCILKSGLILEDHRHVIECYYPLQLQKESYFWRNFILCSTPTLCLFGGLQRTRNIPGSRLVFFFAICAGSILGIHRLRKNLQDLCVKQSLNKLQHTVVGLEKTFVQFKKLLLLVHQNDFISQNMSLCQREMLALRKHLESLLLSSIKKFSQFFDEIRMVPLAVDVDSVFNVISPFDISVTNGLDDESSLDSLKKLYNSYILMQSEYLRRLALCYCPDIWNELTSKKIFIYVNKYLPEILKWSSQLHNTLLQERKLFRTVMESKDKQSHLKLLSSSGWNYSDIYVSIRSASIHFQSLLIQTQGLQDILESGECKHTKNNQEFLNTIAHILTDISKEIHSGQVCIDGSLVQIFKMMNAHQPVATFSDLGFSPQPAEDTEAFIDSNFNPPAEDEVFEFTIPNAEVPLSDEDDWNDMSAIPNVMKKKEAETSKKVLQELKTVLVKKAEEWKERERRALESKGILYTPSEQVKPIQKEEKDYVSVVDVLDFLPTNNQNDWPLPRLKGTLQTHRSFRGVKGQNLNSEPCSENTKLQDQKESSEANQSSGIPRFGFGASLLAEAMAKSREMHEVRKKDVGLSTDDTWSEDEFFS